MPEGVPADATPATEPTSTPEPVEAPPAATPDAPLGAAGEKALAEFKERARNAERELKATKSELTKLQTSTMSETEKAVAEAEERGRLAAQQENGLLLVDAAVRVACADRRVDVDALLEGLDRGRFLDETFRPDTDAITAWVERIAPKPAPEPGPLGSGIDLGQGNGTATTPIGDDAALENLLRDAVGLPKR